MRPSRYFSQAAGLPNFDAHRRPDDLHLAARLDAQKLPKALGNHQPAAAGQLHGRCRVESSRPKSCTCAIRSCSLPARIFCLTSSTPSSSRACQTGALHRLKQPGRSLAKMQSVESAASTSPNSLGIDRR